MSDRTCCVEGCINPIYQGRIYCGSHFMKWYRRGDPLWVRPPYFKDLAGQRFGLLTASHRVGFKWVCQCDCGKETTVLVGDLNRGSARSCGCLKSPRTETAGYYAVHDRVYREKGKARDHQCCACGETAKQWAYDHADPDERASKNGPFSLHPSHYQPMCISCHKIFDMAHIRSTRV